MPDSVKAKADAAARIVGRSALGGLFGAVGVGFPTAAAWLVLVRLEDPLFAATGIGAAHAGASLILFALALRARRRSQAAAQASEAVDGARPRGDLPLLAEASSSVSPKARGGVHRAT